MGGGSYDAVDTIDVQTSLLLALESMDPQAPCADCLFIPITSRWRVVVSSPIGILGDSVLSTGMTGYQAPHILALSPSATSMATTGGDIVTVTGTNFGPMGSLEPLVQYGSNGRVFTAGSCTALGPSYDAHLPVTS
jgi:hypothetical protein